MIKFLCNAYIFILIVLALPFVLFHQVYTVVLIVSEGIRELVGKGHDK